MNNNNLNKEYMKLWDLKHLADKLFIICEWLASCPHPIFIRTSVSYYVWAFLISKFINWTIRGRSFVNIAKRCLYRKMQAQSRECISVYIYFLGCSFVLFISLFFTQCYILQGFMFFEEVLHTISFLSLFKVPLFTSCHTISRYPWLQRERNKALPRDLT